MADKKINGSLEITGKLNPNASGYGFNLPSSAPLTANEKIATEDYVDDALSGIKIGLNGKTYTTTGTVIELPDLAEVKGVPGKYPEYIDATVANGLAGKISWEDLQLSIDDGSIDFAAHTFDAYINFYFPEVLAKYGLYFSNVSGEPIVPGYVSLYSNNPPVTMPDTVVDFATLKAWIIANIGNLVGDSYVDDCIFDNSEANVSYNVENGIEDLNIVLKNGDLVCEARLHGWKGAWLPIVGATNPPTVPGLESTFVGEFRGDAFAGKIKCDSVDAKTIYARNIGEASANGRVHEIHASIVGTEQDQIDIVFAKDIGSENSKARYIYATNIGYPTSKVDYVFATNVGSGAQKVNTIYATNIGVANNKVNSIYAYNVGTSASPVGSIYVTNIGSKNVPVNLFYSKSVGTSTAPVNNVYATNVGDSNKPVTNLYANNVILKNIPTSDPGIAGALWNDGGTLKISAGQQPTA